MDLIEIQLNLNKLTGKKISLAKIGEILGISRAAVSKRCKLGSDIGVSELIKIENFYGVSLYKSDYYSGERQNDTSVYKKTMEFGKRLSELQMKHNFLNKEMAQLLEISEKDYIKLVKNDKNPDMKILNNLKRNFKVSVDWFLYGE